MMIQRQSRGLAADVLMPQRLASDIGFADGRTVTRLLGRAPLRPRSLGEQVLMAHVGLAVGSPNACRDADHDFDPLQDAPTE